MRITYKHSELRLRLKLKILFTSQLLMFAIIKPLNTHTHTHKFEYMASDLLTQLHFQRSVCRGVCEGVFVCVCVCVCVCPITINHNFYVLLATVWQTSGPVTNVQSLCVAVPSCIFCLLVWIFQCFHVFVILANHI